MFSKIFVWLCICLAFEPIIRGTTIGFIYETQKYQMYLTEKDLNTCKDLFYIKIIKNINKLNNKDFGRKFLQRNNV